MTCLLWRHSGNAAPLPRREHAMVNVRARATLLLVPAILVVGSCGQEGCVPSDANCVGPDPVPTTLAVTPNMVTLPAPGTTLQLVATVLDQDDRPIPDAVPTWSAEPASVATVSSSGLVSAQGEGTATVTVAIGGLSREISVSVSTPKILFTSRRDGGNPEVFVMAADGSNPVNLTSHPASDRNPAWSPDYSRIVFASTREDDTSQIHVMNADGSNVVRITDGDWSANPTWSPDGSRIAFTGFRNSRNDVYVMDADGSNVVNVTNDPSAALFPAWSPDGSKIAFSSPRDGGDAKIWVVNVDGTNPVQITTSGLDYLAAWSPDGSQIAYISSDGIYDQIFVVDADGTNATQLTTTSADNTFPAWSPDGSEIVFASEQDGDFEIYVMTADGSNPVRLTVAVNEDDEPAWRSR